AKAAGVASAEHARARAQAESLEASAQNIQAERARLNERLTAAEESVAQARTAYESARTREDSYLAGTGEQAPAAKIERRAQRLGEVLAEQVSEREQQLHELSTALKNAQEGLTSTNDEVQDLQAAHAAALTLLARTQTEAARVQERVQALAERARLVTGLTLEQLEEEYSEQLPVDVPAEEASENAAPENTGSENSAPETAPEPASETAEASTESVRARLKATRAELEALGAINPLALEEYEALSERHAYLNQQIEDLKATRRDLNTVMDEVSSHIAEVFTAAMEDINTHYRRIFETLFPGGEGHLELDDPSDPLNSGVEIHARPAGKKVKRLSLLSGGERSLASLALLIAIYMSRPSPFYALDEVEAALDDRNLSRLLQVIGELGERSQLIVVTHQKRTMQIAETLYGVSMRGGVSTVLSQQMEELRELL
ncbi:AAA family ATPase, partial [Rothia mucilaginosa]